MMLRGFKWTLNHKFVMHRKVPRRIITYVNLLVIFYQRSLQNVFFLSVVPSIRSTLCIVNRGAKVEGQKGDQRGSIVERTSR